MSPYNSDHLEPVKKKDSAKSCLTLMIPWTVAHQAPLSMGFSRQEYWSGLPFPSPGDLPDPGIEPRPPALQADALLTMPRPVTLWITMKWSEVAQSCPTLCNPMDCSLPGSSVHGIFQARVLEWIAISFSKGSSQPRDQTRVSHIVDRRFTVWVPSLVFLKTTRNLNAQNY